MGNRSSRCEHRETHTRSTIHRENAASMIILPSGARIVPEWDQVACPHGHHAFRYGDVLKVWNSQESEAVPLVFCQRCMIILPKEQICARPCHKAGCPSNLLAPDDPERMLCFLEKNHTPSSCVCANCPDCRGRVGYIRAEDVTLITRDFQEFCKEVQASAEAVQHAVEEVQAVAAEVERLADRIHLLPEHSKRLIGIAARAVPPLPSVEDALRGAGGSQQLVLRSPQPVYRAHHLHADTAYQITGRSAKNDHESHSSTTTTTVSCSSSGWFGMSSSSSSSTCTSSNSRSALNDSYQHRQLTGTRDPVTGQFTSFSGNQRAALQAIKAGSSDQQPQPLLICADAIAVEGSRPAVAQGIVIYEQWASAPACGRGGHAGCLVTDAAWKQRFLDDKVFADGHLSSQTKAALGMCTSAIVCGECGQVTTLMYGADQTDLMRSGRVQQVVTREPQIMRHTRTPQLQYLPVFSTIPGGYQAADHLDAFVNDIVSDSLQAMKLYSSEQVARLFPHRDCAANRHVFGVVFHSERYEMRLQAVLETRIQECIQSYSSSSGVPGCFSISCSGGSEHRECHRSLSAVAVRGGISVGVFRCLFCTTTTKDPCDELDAILRNDPARLQVSALSSDEVVGDLRAQPILQNYIRECSASISYGRHDRSLDAATAAADLEEVAGGTALPTMYQWLAASGLPCWEDLFAKLNAEGYNMFILCDTRRDADLERMVRPAAGLDGPEHQDTWDAFKHKLLDIAAATAAYITPDQHL